MKILISAYACEPQKGSEPGVGWHWARETARQHDVWVITRSNNERAITTELERDPAPTMHFIYVDLPSWARFWKRGQRGVRLYYYLWQFAALRAARGAHRAVGFDLVHHLTFATCYLPGLVCFLRVESIWGPVGGGVRPPWRLAPEWGIRGVVYEALRATRRWIGRYFDPLARLTWHRARVILVQNPETLRWLPARHRGKARVVPNGGFEPAEVVPRVPTIAGRTTVITPGRLIHLKGVSLALRAIARADASGLRLIVAGDGPQRGRLERLSRRLGIADRVEFTGWLVRSDLFRLFSVADVLLFPSMHDECGFVVIEAMAHGVVPMVLERGGPALLAADAGYVQPVHRLSRRHINSALSSMLRLACRPDEIAVRRKAVRERADAFAWAKKPHELAPHLVPTMPLS